MGEVEVWNGVEYVPLSVAVQRHPCIVYVLHQLFPDSSVSHINTMLVSALSPPSDVTVTFIPCPAGGSPPTVWPTVGHIEAGSTAAFFLGNCGTVVRVVRSLSRSWPMRLDGSLSHSHQRMQLILRFFSPGSSPLAGLVVGKRSDGDQDYHIAAIVDGHIVDVNTGRVPLTLQSLRQSFWRVHKVFGFLL